MAALITHNTSFTACLNINNTRFALDHIMLQAATKVKDKRKTVIHSNIRRKLMKIRVTYHNAYDIGSNHRVNNVGAKLNDMGNENN